MKRDILCRILDINLKAAINVCQTMAKKMIEAKQPGVIVNVSSQASLVGLENHIRYCKDFRFGGANHFSACIIPATLQAKQAWIKQLGSWQQNWDLTRYETIFLG